MNPLMLFKNVVRRFGYDVRRYHSLYDTVLRHHDIRTIVDIGANDGHWSRDMRTLFPTAQIYAFEPLKDCFSRMTELFRNDPRFLGFNVGLGDADLITDITRSSFHPSTSMLPMADLHKRLYPKSADATMERIALRRLDSLKDEMKLEKDLLIKMDVQGFEDKVIAGGPKTVAQAAVVIIETAFVLLYENQPLFGDIHDLMRTSGFAYRGNCGEHFSQLTGERIYEDSVYVRD